MSARLRVSGSTARTEKFLKTLSSGGLYSGLEGIAQKGVQALQAATPVDSGLTANSWSYEISVTNGLTRISWINTNEVNGTNIAVILQYGHATGTGGYVQGIDYINPAIKKVFDEIDQAVWKKVTSA